jgi:outer membrane protein
MKKYFFLFFCYIFFYSPDVSAQYTKPVQVFTLEDVITLAKEKSPSSKRASTQLETRYWQYKTFQSNYLPQLNLRGTVPNFNRSILPITQNDGSQLFREVSMSSASLNMSLEQNIGLTGGRVFMMSQVQRIDNFSPINFSSYNANPGVIGFMQPIFGFNNLIWDRKIEPLRYEESKREYWEEMELISVRATDIYCNLLLAQISLEIAEKNLANNDTLYKIAEGRYNLGKIAENELLQLELSLMNSNQSVQQAKVDVESGMLNLRMFLGMNKEYDLIVKIPDEIPQFLVDEETAIAEARKNRQGIISFERRRLEARREVARAKGETGFRADLFATFGFTQQATRIPDLYVRPQDQQQINLGFQMPIMDWGRTKSRIKTAQANMELTNTIIEQEEMNFDQEVFLQVKQFKMLRNQLVIAKKSDEIAQRRYDISKSRYMIGKIGITDLNIATQEKDMAKQSYVMVLRQFWNAHYNLRLLTLYDFEKNRPLIQVLN